MGDTMIQKRLRYQTESVLREKRAYTYLPDIQICTFDHASGHVAIGECLELAWGTAIVDE